MRTAVTVLVLAAAGFVLTADDATEEATPPATEEAAPPAEEEAVPEGVFGDVKRAAEADAEPAGALDRFKKRRME